MDPAGSFEKPIYDTSSIHKRHLIPFFPATGQNELCPHFPGDSTFSKLVPRPSVASQGQHRRAHRPAMTGKTSQRSCPFETSTSFSDHEKVQFSGSSRVLDPDSPRSAPGSDSGRTRLAWPSARSRRCWVAWRTWRGNCLAWPPLAATTTWQASVFWRRYTGSCRAARRKSKSADNPRGAAVAARCSHRLCNNRCWCIHSVRRCCTRTSSRNEPRSGSPFFVSYLPRFSTEKKRRRNAVNLTSDYYTDFSTDVHDVLSKLSFGNDHPRSLSSLRWSHDSLFSGLWIEISWSRLWLSTFIYQNERSLVVIIRCFFFFLTGF